MSVASRDRLMRVLEAEHIRPSAPVVSLPSYSNDAWRVGGLVVRVCWRGDLARMEREAQLAAHLPPEVLYPDVVSAGRDGELAWMVTRVVDGACVDSVWRFLDDGERRVLITQFGGILAALHSWRPPPSLAVVLDRSDGTGLADPAAVVGAALNPVSVQRAAALAAHARQLPFVDQRVIDVVQGRLDELALPDPYTAGEHAVVVHGDAHLANVLWRDGHLVALLDFEWACFGPRDLELEPFLRSVNWSGRDPGSFPVESMAQLLGWLAKGYPELFAHPNLVDRLWLYQLAYTIRELYTWPLEAPAEQSAPDHPLNHLPLFAAGVEHIERVLAHVPR